MKLASNNAYFETVNNLKEKIRNARLRAVINVNKELLLIYWEIGNTILLQQQEQGWGAKVIDQLAVDLKTEFPDMKGFSVRNLKYMRTFSESYPLEIVQAPLAQLTWYHHITLMDKIKDSEQRLFYVKKTIENGWSRDVMVHQIESGLHHRSGKLTANFDDTIAPPQSELLQQIFKDPYKFEFISIGVEAKEKDLENALVSNITSFLLELGQGFAFIGRQYKMVLEEREYYYDLLFYHTKLKRYIVIDLKIGDFKSDYAGKMNFYLNIADKYLRSDGDEESIGLILCKTKDGVVAEYALRGLKKPIGIAEYKIAEIPEIIKGELPSIEEIEIRLEQEAEKLQKPLDKKINRLKEKINSLQTEKIKEKRNPENSNKVIQEVVLPLKNKLEIELRKEINNWFIEIEFVIQAGSIRHRSEGEFLSYIKENSHFNEIIFEIGFKGFKSAGTKSYNFGKYLYFKFEEIKYTIRIQNEISQIINEKLYHQLLSEIELNEVVEKFIEELIDDIDRFFTK